MLPYREDRPVTAYDDDWEDLPSSGWAAKWVGGVVVPLVLIAYGVSCVVTGYATLSGRMSMELTGPKAMAMGAACASLGTFLHCHYFWGNLYHLAFAAVLGKIVSLVGLIVSLGYLIIRVGIYGR